MADGLKNIAAPDVEIKIAGKPYRVTAMTLETLGQVEDHVVTLRANPIAKTKEVLHLFTPDEQQALMREAVQATTRMTLAATQEETDAFINSYDGVCYILWLMLRTHQPELKGVEAVVTLLTGMDEGELMRIQEEMKNASGLNALGNSPSQTQQTEEPAE